MAGIVGVTLNQPFAVQDQGADVERFEILYESQSPGKDAPFQDVPLPSVKKTAPAEPRLDITTQADIAGTLLKATLAREVQAANGASEIVTKEVAVFLDGVDAREATDGLADVLAAATNNDPTTLVGDAMANRLYNELTELLADLNGLFDDLDLALFGPLADIGELPTLDNYTFSDPYYERFWQLTWASWSGERAFDITMMVELGMRSSAAMTLGVDYTRRILDSVTDDETVKGR